MIESPRKKGIIFDLDGTLWSTTEQMLSPWNSVLLAKGLPPVTLHQLNGFMGKTPDVIAAMLLPDMPHAKAMEIFEECVAEQDKYLASHGGVLYEGLEETLAILKQNYFLAVVSNCHEKYLDIFLDYHELRRYFNDFETFGRTRLQKCDNIELVIKRNSLASAVYVGDTELDRESAAIAGIPFIWAEYGFGCRVTKERGISSIVELPQIVKKMLSS